MLHPSLPPKKKHFPDKAMPRQTSQGSWKSLTSHSKASSKHTTHLPALFLLPQERLWEIPTFFPCCLAPDKGLAQPASSSVQIKPTDLGEAFASFPSAWGRAEAELHWPLSTLRIVRAWTSFKDSVMMGKAKTKGYPL